MPGVTPEGFVVPTFGELRDSLRARFRSVFGSSVNLDVRTRNGQLIDAFADPLSLVWQLGETLAAAFDPDGAIGVLLENLSALTGTSRRAASSSTVAAYLMGDTAFETIPAGRRAKVSGTTAVFELLADVVLQNVNAWTNTVYVIGDIVKADGACWYATSPTTGSAVNEPSGAGPTFDGEDGVIWLRLGDGTCLIEGQFEAVNTGPVQAYAGTLTEIDTPLTAWTSVYNLLDATPGLNLETDAELRVRRAQEIAGIGSSPLDAIRAKLLQVPGVSAVTVFENTTDVTVDSITPHAIEALVEGGADADIIAALFAATAGGIETCGGVSDTVTDTAGNAHTVKFSRVTEVPIYARLFVSKDGTYPIDGDTQVKAAVVAWGDQQRAGRDAVPSSIGARAFAVAGVFDVPTVYVGVAPSPGTSVTVAISLRQRAVYDTSRIVVTSTTGTP